MRARQDRRLREELMLSIYSEALTECYDHVEIVTFILLSLSCGGWCRYHTHTSRRSRHVNHLGPDARKSRKLFGPTEKSFLKLRHAYSVKLDFSYVAKGIKIKTTAMFHAPRRLRFEDTKRIGHFRVHLSLHFKARLSAKSVMKIRFHSY